MFDRLYTVFAWALCTTYNDRNIVSRTRNKGTELRIEILFLELETKALNCEYKYCS